LINVLVCYRKTAAHFKGCGYGIGDFMRVLIERKGPKADGALPSEGDQSE
jgi:hypothetical protein